MPTRNTGPVATTPATTTPSTPVAIVSGLKDARLRH